MRRIMHGAPTFLWVLIAYLLLKLITSDVRSPALPWFRLTWLELLYFYAAFTGMWELQRVADPGVKNLREAYGMMAMAILFAVLLGMGLFNGILVLAEVVATNYVSWLTTSEFVFLTALSVAQTVIGFYINNRTALRTFETPRG